jgi:hypothetical protein
MASTWSALKIELLETGANSGSWGTLTNINLGDAVLGEAITGQATVDFATDADVTITLTDSATTQAARNLRLNITESSTGIGSVRNLILGSGCQIEKFYLINNTGTGAKTVKNTSGTGISVPAGKATLVYNNGTNVVDAASYFTSLTLGSALPVASGGTGLTAGTSGGIPAYTATGTLTSSGVLAQYGVVIGGGAGAVPTSTAVGTATQVLTSNGSGVAPTFQAIPASGVTSFTAGTTGFTPNTTTTGAVTLAGTLATTNGGTGLTSFTSGGVIYASSSSALATGSALTFNGTNFGVGTSSFLGKVNAGVSDAGGEDGYYFSYSGSRVGSFTVNTNTGEVKIGATNTVGSFFNTFYVNNTEQMRLNSTGLGIGTSSPSTKLHVVGVGQVSGNFFAGFGGTTANIISSSSVTTGGAGFSEFLFGNASVNNRGYLTYGHAADSLLIGTAGGTRATLDSAGNLGLGVTPSAWSGWGVPVLQLSTAGTVISSNQDAYFGANWYYSGGAFKYNSTAAATYYSQIAGQHRWYSAPSGTINTNATFTQAMTLDASGNLGVGTTSPSYKLQLYSAASTSLVVQDAGTALRFLNNSGTNYIQSGTAATADSKAPLIFSSFNGVTEWMRIDTSGNLLVGGTAARGTTVGTAHLDLFNGTAPAGTLTNGVSLYSSSGDLKFMNAAGTDFDVGYRNIPQNSQSAAYTLVLADAGKHIFHPSTDANARTFTIPANSSVAYPIGTAITFINMTSQVVTIAITTDTMYLSSAGTTGSRSLAQYGSATAIKMTSTTWLISGSGLT